MFKNMKNTEKMGIAVGGSILKEITDLIPATVEAVRQETMKKMHLFDSVGKAHV